MREHAWGEEVLHFDTDRRKTSLLTREFSFLWGLATVVLALAAISGCAGYAGQTSSAGGAISPNPSTVDFGNVTLGSQSTQNVSLTNTGTAAVDISQVAISGTGFSLMGNAPSGALAAGQSATIQIGFAPTTAGDLSGGFAITSNAKNSPTKGFLKGKGASATTITLTASPSSIAFGTVNVGSSATQNVTITNTGTGNVSVSTVSASGTGFSVSGITLPYTLAAGASTSFTAQFAPTAAGSASGSVAIAGSSGGSNANASVALSGTGAQGAISASPSSVGFGTVNVGSSATQNVTITNSGTGSASVTTVSASGTGFSASGITLPYTLAAGASTSFTAKFAPTATGSATGSVAIAATAGSSTANATVTLSGTGAQAAIRPNPSSVSFGSVVVGQNNSQPISISNPGNASLTISQISVTGTGFSTSGMSTPVTIQPGQSSSFNVAFGPTSTASVTGSVSVASNAPNSPLGISLSGTGVAATYALSVTPTTLLFGSVNLNTASSQTVSLKNTGNSNITISSISVSGAGFSDSGVSTGVILTPNQSATLTVAFAPTTAGSVTGTVSINSNAAGSPQSISLSGTGAASTTHSVALAWAASVSSGVTGYNVYRGTTAGTYTKINSAQVASTSYTDGTVQSGQNITYYYVVTAVNSAGTESTNSSPATAVVP